MLAPSVELVTVDTFTAGSDTVHNRISHEQLAWLETTLADANARGVKWIVMQGHDPVLGPVRYRHSSHQMYEGGASGWSTGCGSTRTASWSTPSTTVRRSSGEVLTHVPRPFAS